MILPLRWDTVEVALPLPMMRITNYRIPPPKGTQFLVETKPLQVISLAGSGERVRTDG